MQERNQQDLSDCKPEDIIKIWASKDAAFYMCLRVATKKRSAEYIVGKIMLAAKALFDGISWVLGTAMVYGTVKRVSGDLNIWLVAWFFGGELLLAFVQLLRLAVISIACAMYWIWAKIGEKMRSAGVQPHGREMRPNQEMTQHGPVAAL